MHPEHPVKLVVEDDLRRNRLTVFFRIILAIPHLIWAELWTIAMVFVAIANWIATLVTGTPAPGLHRFSSSYVRYIAHLTAYLFIVGNPYPGFVGEEGEYPLDVVLPAPARQSRLTVGFRIILAIPALLLAAAIGGVGSARLPSGTGSRSIVGGGSTGILGGVVGVLGWWASLFRGEMPKGLRDAGAYSIGYSSQLLAYLLFVTDRYPSADPTALLSTVARPPQHPVHLVGDADDLRFSRVTAFFRPLLAIPHLIWLELWGVAATVAVFINWWILLFTAKPAASLHGFVSRYVRYSLHVTAFVYLVANPFPGFTGEQGRYPLDIELPEPARQNKWKTFFRIVLGIPAYCVYIALTIGLVIASILTWFTVLFTGAAPWGLRNYSASALRYTAQFNAYWLLLTDAYPHASPLEGAAEPQHSFAEAT
jgi:hypothetical protein